MEKEYISVDRLRQFAEKINTAISGLDLSEYLKTTDAEEMFATIIDVDNLTEAVAVLAGAAAALAARVTESEKALDGKQDTLKEGENITIAEDNTISASIDVSDKQDKLIAGENITISGSVISAVDTTYTAGTNVQISNNNVISATNTTYSNATTSSAGLMSSTDKITLDSLNTNAVTSVSTNSTSPLTLNTSKSGNVITISGGVDTYDKSTIDEMVKTATAGGLTSVVASGVAPLTLDASVSGTTATITGSVANATTSTAGVVKPYTVLRSAPSVNSATTTSGRYYGVSTDSNNALVVNVPWTDTTSTLSDLGGVGAVNASGTSPLTLSASKSGTSVAITGSVDLSSKQDVLTAGTGISISGSTISCTLDTDVFEVVTTLPSSGIANKIYCVPTSGETGEQNVYTEYLYIRNTWEKIGEFHADVDMSNYYTKSETDLAFATKSEIPTVPTNVSSFTNDAGYITDSSIPTLSDLGGIGSISAHGTSPLTLSTSKSGTAVTINGSVDLSDYYTSTTLDSKFDEVSNYIQDQLQQKQDKLVYYKEYDSYGLLSMVNAGLRISDGEILIDASNVIFVCDTTIHVSTLKDQFLYNNKPVATLEDIPSVVSAFDNDAGYITSATLDDYVTTDTLSSTLSSYALKSIVPTKTSELTNDSGYLTSNDVGENIYIFNLHELATNSEIPELQLFDMFCVYDDVELVELLSKISINSSTLTIFNTYGGEWDEYEGYTDTGEQRTAWYAGSESTSGSGRLFFITPDSSNRKDFTFYHIYIEYTPSYDPDTGTTSYSFSWGQV